MLEADLGWWGIGNDVEYIEYPTQNASCADGATGGCYKYGEFHNRYRRGVKIELQYTGRILSFDFNYFVNTLTSFIVLLGVASAFMAPVAPQSKLGMSKITMGGKGFGGGEATRDPEPTEIDPNDPKGKQQAIHKAESFADYLAKRKAAGGGEIGSSS